MFPILQSSTVPWWWIFTAIYILVVVGFGVHVSRQDPVDPPEDAVFRNEFEILGARQLKRYGRKLRGVLVNFKIVAGFGLFLLIIALIVSPFLLDESLPQVLFATASIQAALGFYVYSIGNTIFSVAESMGQPARVDEGIAINANATLMVGSAGGLVILGITNSINIPYLSFTALQQDVMTFVSLLLLSFGFFLPAVLLHGDYHTWRAWETEENKGGLKHEMKSPDTDIDDLDDRIDDLQDSIVELRGNDEANMAEIIDTLEDIDDHESD